MTDQPRFRQRVPSGAAWVLRALALVAFAVAAIGLFAIFGASVPHVLGYLALGLALWVASTL